MSHVEALAQSTTSSSVKYMHAIEPTRVKYAGMPASAAAFLRPDPMEAARAVIEGYCSVIELSAEELDVLFPLACGRLAVTVCMASARQKEDPENPTWFTSLEPALRLVARLRNIGLG